MFHVNFQIFFSHLIFHMFNFTNSEIFFKKEFDLFLLKIQLMLF